MDWIKSIYRNSVKEIYVTKNLAFCGLMAALAVVLNYTTSFYITPTIRVGFSGIPNRVVEYMFGPVIGAMFGGALDVLKYFLKPDGGAFFPGYTLNAMIAGVVYGMILYKKTLKLWRVFLAELVVKVIVNCGLNTLWLSLMNGKAFLAILPPRVVRNIIMLPIDTAVVFVILTFVGKIVSTTGFRDKIK